MPTISIIVPVYKVEKYIRRCIDSIIAQTYDDWELLLVDDGSPDNSGKICDEYAADDSRIKVIHKENGGVSAARLTGVKTSQGEWIHFVDSDDYIAPYALEVLIAHAKDDIDLIEARMTTKAPIRRNNNPSLSFVNSKEYIMQVVSSNKNWLGTPVCKLFRRDLFIKSDALNNPKWITNYEDTLMCFRYSQLIRKAVYVDTEIYYYEYNANSASKSNDLTAKYHADFLKIWESHLEGGLENPDSFEIWFNLARNFFIRMFLNCSDWSYNDEYMQKVFDIVKDEKKKGRKYTIGTNMCIFAASLPEFLHPIFRIVLKRLLQAKLKHL